MNLIRAVDFRLGTKIISPKPGTLLEQEKVVMVRRAPCESRPDRYIITFGLKSNDGTYTEYQVSGETEFILA